jgi:hypothetical protein
MLLGPLPGIFNLFAVWILYTCWATMHFCNLMFFMFSCGIDLLMILFNFQTYQLLFGNNPFKATLFYTMTVYFIVAFVVAYRAYKCFKD